MVIINPGKKQPKDYAVFRCAVCECEWAEETTKISWVVKKIGPIPMIDHTTYRMQCPNCNTQTATHRVDRLVLKEGGE